MTYYRNWKVTLYYNVYYECNLEELVIENAMSSPLRKQGGNLL